MNFTEKELHDCAHCRERFAGRRQYCNFCTTADGRKKVDIQNKKIRMENEAKGFIYK